MFLQLNWKPEQSSIKLWNCCIALQEASKFIEIGVSSCVEVEDSHYPSLQDSSKDILNHHLWSDNAMDIVLWK